MNEPIESIPGGWLLIDKFQFWDKITGLNKWSIWVTEDNFFKLVCNKHVYKTYKNKDDAKERFYKLKSIFINPDGTSNTHR